GDGLVERGSGGLRAAKDAHVRRPDSLRDVEPLAQLGQLLFAKRRRGLREPHACADAVDFDAVPVGETTQRQQVIVGRVRQPVHGQVDAVGAGSTAMRMRSSYVIVFAWSACR